MALSDELTGLAARAKEAEERAAAAQGKAKADLQADVDTARTSAQAQAKKLRESADANKNKLSVWWNDLQRSWNEHVARFAKTSIPSGLSTTPIAPRRSPRGERTTPRSQFSSRTPRSRRRSTQCSTLPWQGRRRTRRPRPEQGPASHQTSPAGRRTAIREIQERIDGLCATGMAGEKKARRVVRTGGRSKPRFRFASASGHRQRPPRRSGEHCVSAATKEKAC